MEPPASRSLAAIWKTFIGKTIKLRLDIIYKEHNRGHLKRGVLDDIDKLSSVLVSLEELLECHCLSNIEDQQRVVPVSYFRDKLVGLYIYFGGEFLEELGDVLDDCDNEGRSFEIVLIRLSGRDDPSSILKDVILGLKEHEISASNWWTFPFNHKVCQKLWRIVDCDYMDKLIIVPPPGDKNRSGDLQGKAVMRDFNGISVYPFTRETILERQLAALSSVTLESVLREYDHLVRNKPVTCFSWGEKEGEGKKWTVADLRGKHILLYIDDFDYNPCGSCIFDKIRSLYSQIQAKYPDSEVVFSPLCESSCNVEGEVVSKMPWLRLPFFSPCVAEQLLVVGSPCIVAFGKDGRVCSREAHRKLDWIVPLFRNHLRQEIVDELYQLNQDD